MVAHRGLAAEADFAGALVDADALHGDHLAHLHDVFGAAHALLGEFADVAETFFARGALDEAAEVFDAGHAAGVGFVQLDGFAATTATAGTGTAAAEAVDFLDGTGHRVAVVGVDEDLSRIVVGDVDLRAGRLGDAADRLAAGPDEQADLLGVDLDRLDARGVLAEAGAGRGQRGDHRLDDFDAGVAGLEDRGLGDLEGQAVDLQVELESGDTLGGAGDLEVHVAEVVFFTEDVGDGGPLGDRAGGVHLGHETAGDTGNGSDDRHAGVHEGQATAADRSHRGRAVGGHDLGDDADAVWERILGRENRNERAFGEGAVADFATAGADETAGFADGERREVVMKEERFRGRAAGEAVHLLGFFRGPEGDDSDVLGVAALEHGGTVNAREDADLSLQGPQGFRIAVVGADALGEDGGAVGFVLEIFEDDVEVDIGELAFAELGEEGRLGLVLEGFDVGGADVLLKTEDGGGDAVSRDDALDDGAGLGGGADELEGGLGFAGESGELLDGGDDRLDGFVAEGEGLDETLLGDLVGGTLDHEHVLGIAHVDEVERRGIHLLDGGVGDELVVDEGDADGADGPVPWNVGDGEGGGGAVDHRDVGIVDQIGRHEGADDLNLIEETLGEEWAAGTVAEAGNEDLALGRTALAFEITAGEAAGGGVFVAVVAGEGEEVLTGTHGGRGASGDEDVGLADVDVDGAARELGDGAGGEGHPEAGNGDIVFLIHSFVDDFGRFGRFRISAAKLRPRISNVLTV